MKFIVKLNLRNFRVDTNIFSCYSFVMAQEQEFRSVTIRMSLDEYEALTEYASKQKFIPSLSAIVKRAVTELLERDNTKAVRVVAAAR